MAIGSAAPPEVPLVAPKRERIASSSECESWNCQFTICSSSISAVPPRPPKIKRRNWPGNRLVVANNWPSPPFLSFRTARHVSSTSTHSGECDFKAVKAATLSIGLVVVEISGMDAPAIHCRASTPCID